MSGADPMSFWDALDELQQVQAEAGQPLDSGAEDDDAERWLRDFAARPSEVLDDLIRGYGQIAPYFRAEPAEALVHVFEGGADRGVRALLDRTLAEWLADRMTEPAPVPERRNALAQYIRQALMIVRRLDLAQPASLLTERLDEATAWVAAVTPPSYDLRFELWLTLAHVQSNRSLLSFWYGLCDQVGWGLLDAAYLDVALLGLRALPQTEDDLQPGPELLRGLARWARSLPASQDARERFTLEWRSIAALYPRGPDRWQERVTPVLEGYTGKPFAKWWAEEVGAQGRDNARPVCRANRKPGKDDTDRVLTSIAGLTGKALVAAVEDFACFYERHSDETGDLYFLPRAFNRVGNALLNRREKDSSTRNALARLALRLAASAVMRDRNNEQSRLLWARALERLGRRDRAEAVLWEAAREFPDDQIIDERTKKRSPVFRNELAALLVRQGRFAEAEAMYRDTMHRFPDVVSRNALARLWADHGQAKQAETLYLETMVSFCNDEVCRTDLARLLREQGRAAEAEALYRQTCERFSEDPVCRLDLGLLLLDRGRPVSEVEPLLAELRAMRASEARTLAAHLDAVRQGRARPHGEEPMPETAPAATDGAPFWQGMACSAAAMREAFRLSPAFDIEDRKLLLVTPQQRDALQAQARAELGRLMATHPYHPVVRLVAQRYGPAEAVTAAPRDDDYPLRLELARADNSGDFAALLADRRFDDKKPITALAWLLADDADAQEAAAVLLPWLQQRSEDVRDPILNPLHTRLSRIIARRLDKMTADQFLEAWDEEWAGPAASLNAVLDLTVLALVAREAPYAAAAWEPELAAA